MNIYGIMVKLPQMGMRLFCDLVGALTYFVGCHSLGLAFVISESYNQRWCVLCVLLTCPRLTSSFSEEGMRLRAPIRRSDHVSTTPGSQKCVQSDPPFCLTCGVRLCRCWFQKLAERSHTRRTGQPLRSNRRVSPSSHGLVMVSSGAQGCLLS